MNESVLSKIMSELVTFSECPHLLLPRTGTSIVQAFESWKVNEFLTWRYFDIPVPDFPKPSSPMRVDSSTVETLAHDWQSEAYGAAFPEILYLPTNTPDSSFRAVNEFCQARRLNPATLSSSLSLLKNALASLEWVIAPIHIEPFMGDEPTYFSLAILRSIKDVASFRKEMLHRGVPTFQLDATSVRWPVAEQHELEARRIWNTEIRRFQERERQEWEQAAEEQLGIEEFNVFLRKIANDIKLAPKANRPDDPPCDPKSPPVH